MSHATRIGLALTCTLTLAACGDELGGAGGTGASGATNAPSTGATSPASGPGGQQATGSGTQSGNSGAAQGSTSSGMSPGTVWFREPFEELGAQNMYGFGNRYEQSDTTWQTEHLPAGGNGGTGGAHVRLSPCEGCSTSTNQFSIGWVTPELASLGKPSSAIGDRVFIRWRIRFDDDARWTVDSPAKHSAKFVLYGSTGEEPNSRVILHLFNPYENGGCSLGFRDYAVPPSPEWVNPVDWGMGDIDWFAPSLATHYAAFTAHVNIGWDCSPGVLVTHGDNAATLAPQHTGAGNGDGWYHLQYELKSGDGDARFRIWSNNNDENNPSSHKEGFSLHTAGWDGGVDFGGYWGIASGAPMGFVVDDLEVGDSFAPGWYPGP